MEAIASNSYFHFQFTFCNCPWIRRYVTGSTIMRNKSGHVNAGKTTSKFVGVIFH